MAKNKEILKKALEANDGQAYAKAFSVQQQILSQWKTAFNNIRSEIKYYDDKGQLTQAEMNYKNRLGELETKINSIVKDIVGKGTTLISKGIKDVFSITYSGTGEILSKSIGSSMFMINPDLVEAAVKNKYDLIKWENRLAVHAEKYKTEIRDAVSQGLITGKGYSEIAHMVKSRSEIGAGKVLRIARTETHRAQIQGRREGFKATQYAAARQGMKTVLIWSTSGDERVREDHSLMDGKEANDEGLFDYFGSMVEGPGLVGSPEADINCRCSIICDVRELTEEEQAAAEQEDTFIPQEEEKQPIEDSPFFQEEPVNKFADVYAQADKDFMELMVNHDKKFEDFRAEIFDVMAGGGKFEKINQITYDNIYYAVEEQMMKGLSNISQGLDEDMRFMFNDWYGSSSSEGASMLKYVLETRNGTQTYYHEKFIDSVKKLVEEFKDNAEKRIRDFNTYWKNGQNIEKTIEIYQKGLAYKQRINENLLDYVFSGEKIKVYRGVREDYFNTLKINAQAMHLKDIKIMVNSVESWTVDFKLAKSFAGKGGGVFEIELNPKDVVASFIGTTGKPIFTEFEVVLSHSKQVLDCTFHFNM